MSKILILGGSGFIGSNLSMLFSNLGEEIIVFDENKSNNDNLSSISREIIIINENFLDSLSLERVFDDNQIDIVIHLICSIIPGTSFKDVMNDMNLNLRSTMELIDIMQRKNVKKFVFLSSGGTIYGLNSKNINSETDSTNPIDYYGWLKLTIEKYIKICHNIHGLNYIIIRPSNAYGKYQNIYGNQGLIANVIGKIMLNKEIEIWGDGEVIRDYIYVDDLCMGIFNLIVNNKWNDIYNVGTQQGTSVKEVLQIIRSITGINFCVTYKQARNIDVPINILNISKIKGIIDYDNLIPLEKGIQIMWDWINEKTKND